ncbi:MarR family winged helix-turn-helix transcriptional regulator [Streptomyces beigongshangae]|uniref:MarR family winged helix-turn-helix transcriptional regulator n=1 Tax=Streptomyces beigongshangae TaxID=2841597 RepID=UPI001C857E71|nr:MarR family transcriptional regulator [Streptomyces sp. REN17]
MHEGGNEEGHRTRSGGPAGGVDQETAGRVTEDRVTEDQEEFLALERELTVLLRRARASSGEMAREVHPDLESSAYGLLVRLEERGRQRATELAAYIGVGKATMSRQLRALEEVGLVAREPDPADGRAWLVHLTQEGRERFRVVRAARRARYVSELANWERGEVADLARLLRRLNRGVERG